ncbi:PDZ domain-containing protein [Cohnella sp. CFH 77786]|uniref:S41 family peptidase n=1 Tax=Cohnella sp. CFH 77786 TaxID=2662265 RepID=UPI001C60D40E|nr:S41 family peptidase [Cohnella sp. CFH 77786]MBW5448199.1 PDZ domain-containing protein [Cohnella sp. CFH 77786]
MMNRMNIRRRASFALLAALVGATIWMPSAARAETSEQVNEVRQLLEQYHLSKPDDKDLNQSAIDGMVETLHDPYTEYFDEEEWKKFSSDLEQNFTGIGIVLIEEDGVVYAEDVIPGSPAEAAGLLPGDAIVSADGKSVRGLNVTELQKQLRGAEGTRVTVGVERDGKTLAFPIVRKTLQLPVATGQMMGDGVGYVALSGFTSDAGSLFADQVAKLEKAGMRSLLIDLRNNGGGYVTAAQHIAGLFIKDGVLAHLKDRDGKDDPISVSGGGKPYPVTILVNGNSASASELLAGALQDYGVAKLVGTKTFGKGVVQSIIPLKSGGVLKVTVQEYYTPNGRKVDKTGLTPDHVIEGAGEQLIGAYRDAGGKALTVGIGKGSVVINGVRTARPNAAFRRGSSWYVNLRLAAALAGAKVGYDSKTKTITLSRGSTIYKLKSGDSRLANKNGFNLIDSGTLARWFPGLTAEAAANGQLKLTVR